MKKILTRNNKIFTRNGKIFAKTIAETNGDIIITFDSPPTNFSINKANLKYDKDFAHSFCLDDGSVTQYTIAFPTLQSTGGTYSSGLTYTDGCGHNINFKAGLALYSLNNLGGDVHINTPSYLTWTEITELCDFGWDVFNHGFRAGISTGSSYSTYYGEVTGNTAYIALNTGYVPIHMAVPNGDEGYNIPALNAGELSLFQQLTEFVLSASTKHVSNTGVDVSNIDFYQYCMYKKFWYWISGSTGANTGITSDIISIANKSTGSTNYWWQDFTHNITASNGSLDPETFNYYMNYIENNYGKNGNDKVWMAPYQEVYEYIYIRDNTNVSYTTNGNVVTVNLGSKITPNYFRRNCLSLLASDSTANITNIQISGFTNYSYNGTGTKSSLINLDWGQSVINMAEKYVTLAENDVTLGLQASINKAQYFVNQIYVASTKAIYQARLDNIYRPVTLPYRYLIDFGTNSLLPETVSGVTWNRFNTNTTGVTSSYLVESSVNAIVSTINFVFLSGFTGKSSGGAQTGDDTGVYPDSRMIGQVYAGSTFRPIVEISGLNTGKTYNIIIFGSTTNGANLSNYTIGSTTLSLQVLNNMFNRVNFDNVTPSAAGKVDILFTPTATQNMYLNVLEIIENGTVDIGAYEYNSNIDPHE